MSFVAIQKLALQPLFLGSQLEGTILIHDLLSFFLLDLFSYKNQGKEIARNWIRVNGIPLRIEDVILRKEEENELQEKFPLLRKFSNCTGK
jgi:hypothetical protein